MLLKAAGVEKGSGEPHKTKVATVTRDQVREIAQTKMADLNANSLDEAEKIMSGRRMLPRKTADSTKDAASTSTSRGAPSTRSSTPVTPGPATWATARLASSLPLPSTSWSRPTRAGR